jgi:hypothetical protein
MTYIHPKRNLLDRNVEVSGRNDLEQLTTTAKGELLPVALSVCSSRVGRAFKTDARWLHLTNQTRCGSRGASRTDRPLGGLVGAYGSREEGSLIRPSG